MRSVKREKKYNYSFYLYKRREMWKVKEKFDTS